MTDAQRQRRYRERIKRGIQVVPIEVSQSLIDVLLAQRLIKITDIGDRRKISAAIQALLKFL